MPSMTEDLGGIARGIAASRRKRREAMLKRRREAGSRHRAVGEQLRQIKTMRQTMAREQRKDAAAGRQKRLTQVEGLLRQFRRNREENAAAARVRAAAFMRDLTGRVAALRDAFRASREARAKSRHDLVKALQDQLASDRRDRHDASAAWRGMPVRQAPPPAPGGAHRPTPEPYTTRAGISHVKPAETGPGAAESPAAEPLSRAVRQRGPHAASGEDTGAP